MTFTRNILIGYISQIYVTLVGILILPLYFQYMNAEAYGLVGFFAMLQGWFNLLDLGLTPTVARETARFHGGASDALSYRRLLRALHIIFFSFALLGGGSLFLLAGEIAIHWLKLQTLPLVEVKLALQLMAASVALRWMSGFYRGCVSGAERLIWLGWFNAFISTLRFVGVLPVLIWVGHTPSIFFCYQLLIAIIEQVGLFAMSCRLAPPLPQGVKLGWSLSALFATIKPVFKFSISIAFTSSIWVLVTQTDKLLLSNILPLDQYGYFTLAVLVASSIMIVSGPVSGALMPRMTRLDAEGDEEQLIAAYRQATQVVVIVTVPAVLVLGFFAKQVLWAWTGDAELVQKAAPVLTLYAVGYGFLVAGAFPYYLQYAKGKLRLHLINNAIFILLLIPSTIWAGTNFGMGGAGWAWLISNAVGFVVSASVVHSKFFPGMHWSWLIQDIAKPMAIPLAGAALANYFMPWANERIWLVLQLFALGIALMLLAELFAGRIQILKRGLSFGS